MTFPFAPWEYPQWRPYSLQNASTQHDGYLLKFSDFDPSIKHASTLSRLRQLFFRSIESQDEANFVLTGHCAQPFIGGGLGMRPVSDVSTKGLPPIFEEALRLGQFARIFFLNEREVPRQGEDSAYYLVVVAAHGWGQWILLSQNSESRFDYRRIKTTAFRWSDTSDPNHFLSLPALEIWSQIQSQKEDGDSDCAFARRALDLSNTDMADSFCHWEMGTRTELLEVLKSALLCHSEVWESETGYGYAWNVYLGKFRTSVVQFRTSVVKGPLAAVNPDDVDFQSPAPIVLLDLIERIKPYFNVRFHDELFSAHLESARWVHCFRDRLSVYVENPTIHERLEAALFWREWQNAHPVVE